MKRSSGGTAAALVFGLALMGSEREQESLPSPRGRSDPVCGVAAPPNTARYSSSRRLASGATSAAGLGPGFLLTLSASCKREAPSPGPAASASTVAPAGRPPTKAYSNPPDREVGTLPPGVGLAVGTAAPDATLLDAGGRHVSLRDLASRGPLLIVFYRGGWCPFCNFQIHELTTAFPEFRRRGVTPVAISVDRVEEAARTRATYEIPFPVLSDQDLLAHRAFHVVRHVDDAELSRLKGMGLDLEGASGRDHHSIAVPAIFIVDRAGVVRWAHANVDYKIRPSTPQLLQALDQVLR